MYRMIEMARIESHHLGLVLGLAVAAGLLAFAPPMTIQALVNTAAIGGMEHPLVVLTFIISIFMAFSYSVYKLESHLVELVQRRILMRIPVDHAHQPPKVGGVVNDTLFGITPASRLFDVLDEEKAGTSLLLLDGVSLLMQAGVGMTLLAIYHSFLLSFNIVLLLTIGLMMYVSGRYAVATAFEESKSKHAMIAWLEIIANNLFSFKSDSGSKWAVDLSDQLAQAYLAGKRAHRRIILGQIIGLLSLYAMAISALLAIGGFLVLNGQISLGQLVASELILCSVMGSLVKFGRELESVYGRMSGADKSGHLPELPLEPGQAAATKMSSPATLAVHGLSFGLGSKRPALVGLDFVVEAGERVAVLGDHGCGKSRLAQIICGMSQPLAGEIKFDGDDIEHHNLQTLRNRIAIVGPLEIIENSLFENVRLGRPHIGLAEVEHALAAVGLLDELAKLPTVSLETVVGHDGWPLSGNQARLLMIARAIADRPALLVLDGILDELDEVTRLRLEIALFDEDAPWTLLVLTSFPSVAALCGRVVELPNFARSTWATRKSNPAVGKLPSNDSCKPQVPGLHRPQPATGQPPVPIRFGRQQSP